MGQRQLVTLTWQYIRQASKENQYFNEKRGANCAQSQ